MRFLGKCIPLFITTIYCGYKMSFFRFFDLSAHLFLISFGISACREVFFVFHQFRQTHMERLHFILCENIIHWDNCLSIFYCLHIYIFKLLLRYSVAKILALGVFTAQQNNAVEINFIYFNVCSFLAEICLRYRFLCFFLHLTQINPSFKNFVYASYSKKNKKHAHPLLGARMYLVVNF